MDQGFEKILRSTLKISCMTDFHNEDSFGTGFLMLYRKPDQPNQGNHILLITNKHVLKTDLIKLTFGIGGLSYGLEPDSLYTHYFANVLKHKIDHPDPRIDISLLPFGGAFSEISNLSPQFTVIDYTEIISQESWINIGTEVLYVGYPCGVMDATHNLPLMRYGIISSYPMLDFNGKPKFIIDSHAFGGSSGSPVFAISRYPIKYKLIGVLSGGYEIISYQGKENIGLATVEKISGVKDLMDFYIAGQYK